MAKNPWQCELCEKVYVVASLARHCEWKHLDEEEEKNGNGTSVPRGRTNDRGRGSNT